jgi:transposase
VAEVCRRYDISSALIYTWRRKLREAHVEPASDDLAAPGFAAAVMIEDDDVARPGLQPAIIIDLARGKRISTFASASPALAASALKALR